MPSSHRGAGFPGKRCYGTTRDGVAEMTRRHKEVKRRVFAMLLCAPLCSCATVHPVSKDLVREETRRVSLVEERDRGGAIVPKGFDHPWDVDADALGRLLSSVLYRKEIFLYKGKPSRAFPEEELRSLLPHLQKAFAAAGPDQWVDFSFVQVKTWAVVQRRYLTDGVLFRKGATLHCAFRNIAYEERGSPEESYGPYLEDPTSRPVPAQWSLVTGQGQQLEAVKKPGLLGAKIYPNWIKLDMPAILGSASKLPAAHEPSSPAPAVGGAGQTGQPGPQSSQEIEDKLLFLEELNRQGLIAPSSYQEKREELLRALEAIPGRPK